MISQLVSLIVVAILVEAVIHVIFSIKGLRDFDKKIKWFPIQVALSLSIAIATCFHVRLDMFQLLFPAVQESAFGFVLTGLIVSRGSNYVHDIIKKISDTQKQIISQ